MGGGSQSYDAGRVALGTGLHHGAGGRHTGDAPPSPVAARPPIRSPISVVCHAFPISVLRFSELLSPFPRLIFFLEFSQRFGIFLRFLFDPPCSLFSQSLENFLLPCPYFSLLPPLLSFVFIPSPRAVC